MPRLPMFLSWMRAVCAITAIGTAQAATINWSAGIDHGLSQADGTELPADNLLRLGWFRDPGTGDQLTDAQIQAIAGSTSALNAAFVEAGSSSVGTGLEGAPGHFSAVTGVNTASLNLVGKQMYLWVLNAPTLAGASQQAILYWDIKNTTTNPDSAPSPPGSRWAFPAQLPLPGTTNIDITDLTTGSGALASGARLVVGSYPNGTSSSTLAPNFGLAPLASALSISSASPLTPAIKGQTYTQTLTASGGTGPYTWSISAGALPDGLTLSDSGGITGTPTVEGAFSVTVQVSDSASGTAIKPFNLQVSGSALQILTAAVLPNGIKGGPYSQALSSGGGVAPHIWQLTEGTLPPGLQLSSAGVLSGTPTLLGSYEFEATVTDASHQQAQRTFTLAIMFEPTILTPSTLTAGVLKLPYAYRLTVSDTRPYTWSVPSGALPAGLQLSTGGLLSGKPTAAGTANFTVQAAGPGGVTATKSLSLTILATNVLPTLTPPVFPDAVVGANGYEYQIQASPQPATVTAIGLPPGLHLNATTGWVSGSPTIPGIYIVRVRARNAIGSSPEVQARLEVKPLPTGAIGTFVALVDPNAAINGNLGGRIDLTTTPTGAYTLNLTQGTASFRNTGTLSCSLDGSSPKLSTVIGSLQIALTLDAANNLLTGTVSGGKDTTDVNGWRQIWHPANRPTTQQAGYYNLGMNLASQIGIETVPQGTGFLKIQIGTGGIYSFSGMAANGSALTGAGFLSPTNGVLIYARHNGNVGVIQGVLSLSTDAGGSIAGNTIAGSLFWVKAATVTQAYPAAFGPVTLNVNGKYLASAVIKNSLVLGLPASSPTAALTFTESGIESAFMDPSIAAFSFLNLKPVLPGTSSLNPAATKLTIDTETGSISGTFTLVDGRVRRAGTYNGIIVRTADATLKAEGFFLLPKLPVLGSRGLPPVLSGKVQITQP